MDETTTRQAAPGLTGDGSAAERIANHLRSEIACGRFEVGDPLPRERDMMETFAVSRSTVREALRMLDAQGLVEVRRGRSGGSFVTNPSTGLMVQSLDLFIKGRQVQVIDLVMAREAIECAAAAQAAMMRTEDQLERLRASSVACSDALHDFPAFVQANLDWHLALLEASNNPLFITFMNSIWPAISASTDREEFDIQVRKMVVGIHWHIFLAIEEKDPVAAQRRMQRHLSAHGDVLKSHMRPIGS